MSEPVAIRYDFDGNGYLYMDAGSGSDWASRVKDCEFLYTHPIRELNEPIAWMHTNSKKIFKTEKPNQFDLPLFTPLYTHPMSDDKDDDIFRKEQVEKFYAEAKPLRDKYKHRELTDEEIINTLDKICYESDSGCVTSSLTIFHQTIVNFARAILKKASEK
jgi:hypothetical protein